jgi:hypothetical protein
MGKVYHNVLTRVAISKIDIISRNLKKFNLNGRSELKHEKIYQMDVLDAKT